MSWIARRCLHGKFEFFYSAAVCVSGFEGPGSKKCSTYPDPDLNLDYLKKFKTKHKLAELKVEVKKYLGIIYFFIFPPVF